MEWTAAGQPEQSTSNSTQVDGSGAASSGSQALWQSPAATDDAVMWDARVIDVFLNGISVDFIAYPEDDRDLRVQYNSGIHDDESNKYRETSLVGLSALITKAATI